MSNEREQHPHNSRVKNKDDRSIAPSFSAFSDETLACTGARTAALSFKSSSQCHVDSFAMGFAARQGMGLDAVILHSAMMGFGDTVSLASASSYRSRRDQPQMNLGTRQQISTSQSFSASRSSSNHSTLQQSAVPISHHQEQQRHPSENQKPAHAFMKASERLQHLRSQSEMKCSQTQNSKSPPSFPSRRSKGEVNSRDSQMCGETDIQNFPPDIQQSGSAIMHLKEPNSIDNPTIDVEKVDGSPQTTRPSSLLIKKTIKPVSMWDQKKSFVESNRQKDQVNLNSFGYDTYTQNDKEEFMDEIPLECMHVEGDRLHERGISLSDQMNKRKRIKISKRKKKLKHRQRNKSFYATVLIVVGVVLLLLCVLTLVFISQTSKKGPLEQNGSVDDVEWSSVLSPTESSLVNDTFPNTTIVAPSAASEITTVSPTIASTVASPPSDATSTCFTSREELKLAVDAFMSDQSKYSTVARKYGFPIGDWCTSLVTDFSELFHSGDLTTGLINHEDPVSINFAHFDDSLSNWDVSNGVSFAGTFRGARHFSGRGLDKWWVALCVVVAIVVLEKIFF
jgi:hypothetical protein